MEIAVSLGDTLGIIWRLQHHQEIPGDHRSIYLSFHTAAPSHEYYVQLYIQLCADILQYHQRYSWDYMEIVVPLGHTLGVILRSQQHQEIPWGLYGGCSTTRSYLETIQGQGYCSTTRRCRWDNMEIVVPLGDTLGIIWRLQYYQEIPWRLYRDCSTIRRYPGDYMEIVASGDYSEIVAPLVDTWRLYGECNTTRRYPGDDMEIVSPLGDTIWTEA